ncbi:hypothetical protein J0I05_04955 [Candidatus Saccharibacteria bacterium]|nr:hypothetical protein [Candidatus Saccharibacteria bacterium]
MTEHLRISFVRHGEHTPEHKNPALTHRGIEEGEILRQRINTDPERTIGYAFPARRSLATVALAINPAVNSENLYSSTFKLLAEKRLSVSSDLSYLGNPHEEFKSSIDAASKIGRGLAFLVKDSDTFLDQSPHEISTLSRTSFQVSRFVEQSIAANVDKDIDDIVVCAREFVYPSFKAALIARKQGQGAANDYAEWYGENKELVDSVRLDVATLYVEPNGITIEDTYSSIQIDSEDLQDVQNEYLQRVSNIAEQAA